MRSLVRRHRRCLRCSRWFRRAWDYRLQGWWRPARYARWTWLLRRMLKQRYVPEGKRTTPPPADAAASMARLTASVSRVFPSPVAPNWWTSNTPGWPVTGLDLAAYEIAGMAAPAKPRPPVRKKSRRNELKLFIDKILREHSSWSVGFRSIEVEDFFERRRRSRQRQCR